MFQEILDLICIKIQILKYKPTNYTEVHYVMIVQENYK